MAHKSDINKAGWEQGDFPILCETCSSYHTSSVGWPSGALLTLCSRLRRQSVCSDGRLVRISLVSRHAEIHSPLDETRIWSCLWGTSLVLRMAFALVRFFTKPVSRLY